MRNYDWEMDIEYLNKRIPNNSVDNDEMTLNGSRRTLDQIPKGTWLYFTMMSTRNFEKYAQKNKVINFF